MTMPFTLPDWMPWWVPIVLLVPAILYGLAFLFMPFSVIGLKGRLETIEARLDEIQGEIRSLVLRMPEPSRALDFDEVYGQDAPRRTAAQAVPARPPIPPASHELDEFDTPRDAAARQGFGRAAPAGRPEPRPPNRAEPRLDWPPR
jgi:hypothetical protein